jgi:hypothetical protein
MAGENCPDGLRVSYNYKFTQTASLCVNYPNSNFGATVIHEWAHSCGWDHGQKVGVPNDPGTDCISLVLRFEMRKIFIIILCILYFEPGIAETTDRIWLPPFHIILPVNSNLRDIDSPDSEVIEATSTDGRKIRFDLGPIYIVANDDGRLVSEGDNSDLRCSIDSSSLWKSARCYFKSLPEQVIHIHILSSPDAKAEMQFVLKHIKRIGNPSKIRILRIDSDLNSAVVVDESGVPRTVMAGAKILPNYGRVKEILRNRIIVETYKQDEFGDFQRDFWSIRP